MRRVGEPIQVQMRDTRPSRITWGDRTLTVQDLMVCWVHQTGWWKPGGGERRVYYRLRTNGGVVEVYRTQDGAWTLSRIVD